MLFVEQFLYSGYISEETYQKIEEMFQPQINFLISGQQDGVVKQLDTDILKAQMEGSVHEIIKMLHRKGVNLNSEQLKTCFEMAWDAIRQ